MDDLLTRLRAVPARFHLLALLGSATAGWLSFATDWDPWRHSSSTLSDGWGSVVGALTTVLVVAVPLLALRWPGRAVALCFLPFLLALTSAAHQWPFAVYVAALVAAQLAAWDSPRRAAGLTLVASIPVVSYLAGVTAMLLPFRFEIDATHAGTLERMVTGGLHTVAATVVWALAVWMRRSALSSRRAAGLEARSAEVERESALVGERARLARDLHDVVAHHVSLIAVRAETAPYTLPGLSPAARGLLDEIATDSRRALDELRGVLGVLRRTTDGAELAPQPTASDIAELVERSRSTGTRVEWAACDLSTVAPTAGYAAFRVVQEALTNARRHAPGQPVVLVTRPDPTGGITVRVSNRGAGGSGHDGRGLVGMRERVEGLGGELTVTRGADAFALEAWLPGGTP